MALFWVPVTLFGEQKEDLRFEEMNNYYTDIEDLTNWMKNADIVWRVDSLHDQSFDTFWQLANKLQYDVQKYASSCILKVESISVPMKCGEYGDDVTMDFHGYFVCGEYNVVGPSSMYLQEYGSRYKLFKLHSLG